MIALESIEGCEMSASGWDCSENFPWRMLRIFGSLDKLVADAVALGALQFVA
jgi:hypothetical protein